MNKEALNKILYSIKCDDLTSFSSFTKDEDVLNLSFGRFPILSICYLYKSKKIIKNYEKTLLAIENYKKVEEPFFIYKSFKKYAKKSLRLYLDGTNVSPLEMLAILHEDNHLKSIFEKAYKDEKIIANLNIIYGAIYNQNCLIKNNKIKIGCKRISSFEFNLLKKCSIILSSFILCVVMAFFALDLGFGAGFTTPSKIYSSSQFVSSITTSSKSVLNEDLSIKSGSLNCNFSGYIDGNNHTIYLDTLSKYLIKNNSGTIKNLNIIYRLTSEQTISENTSLLCLENSGIIENVNIFFVKNDSEQITVLLNKNSSTETYFNGFAQSNSGTINNCNLLINVSVVGQGESGEGYCSGFVGVNSGVLSNCKVSENSQIIASNIDCSGFVVDNQANGIVKTCTNKSVITQNNDIASWSPNVAGIVLNNSGNVTSCRNEGNLSIFSTIETVDDPTYSYLGGICAVIRNSASVSQSKSTGNLTVNTKTQNVYCGGVSAYCMVDTAVCCIDACGVEGVISVIAEGTDAKTYVGGFCGLFYGQIKDSFSLATYVTAYDGTKNYVGSSFGVIYYYVYGSVYQSIAGSNNYVLKSENVEKQIGVMVHSGGYYSSYPGQETGTNSLGQQVVDSLTTAEQVRETEVYYE